MTPEEHRQLRRRFLLAGNGVNFAGGAVVTLFLVLVFPPEDLELEWLTTWRALGLALAGFAVAAVVATRACMAIVDACLTGDDAAAALAVPWRCTWVSLRIWLVSAVAFGALAAVDGSPAYGLEVATSLLLAGVVTGAADFLAVDRVMRPVYARVMHGAAPEAGGHGLDRRLLLTWTLCTAVPVAGIALVPVGRAIEDPQDLVAPVWFACAMAIVAGFVGTKLVTQAVAGRVRELRRAVDAVAAGDLEAGVVVDDASEVGRLQAGFNAMVEGLRERERLRDLLDRQVGAAVARQALSGGVSLGGREQEISALFVDVIGSTAMACREAPADVIAALNRFFAVVVEVVERHGGVVNKFEGDAALCLFGAPEPAEDHAARALRAALALREGLAGLEPELQAAIGVASGTAVVGYVGAESRFEWTAIGNPVNEAARLTELAKARPGHLLASAAAVDAAGLPGWERAGESLLRGRDAPTPLAVPAAGAPA
jgi:adenylate cyclase